MKTAILTLGLLILPAVGAQAQPDIRRIDFKNYSYQPSCLDMEGGKPTAAVAVKAGSYSGQRKIEDFVEQLYFAIVDVTYGDLTGDGQDEAVVLTICNTGGTGQFSEGFIYGMKAGKPALLARVPGGDRADGGLRSLTVEAGQLVVDANDPMEGGGACCPEFAVRTRAKLVGNKLVEVGKGVRRELYPKTPVVFAQGASSATVTVRVDAGDRKRYTLRARAKQTLSVSVDTGALSLELMGDAEAKAGKNSFTAVLPKSGAYTFEVVNDGEKPVEARVTVAIK